MPPIHPASVCVLIPALNEARSIERVVLSARDQGFDVLVVNDGSTDDTVGVARRAGAQCLSHPKNMGKGKALKTGFEFIRQSPYEAVIVMDGDGQHDSADLAHFVRALQEGHRFIIGNRMNNRQRMPIVRRWTNGLMSAWISMLSGQKIPDTQSGFRALHREVLSKINLFTEHFEIETEMILEASKSGIKIIWIPIMTHYVPNQKSHIQPVLDTRRFFGFLWSYYFDKKNRRV